MKISKGFSLLETSLTLALVSLLYISLSPGNARINQLSTEAKRAMVTTEIEIAKNRFEQDSTPKEVLAFNAASEEEKFTKLSAYLKVADPALFFQGAQVSSFVINELNVDTQLK